MNEMKIFAPRALTGEIERGSSAAVGVIQLCALFDQRPDDGQMAAQAAPAQRRQPLAVDFRRRGAFADEVLEDAEMPFAGRDHQRRPPVTIRHLHRSPTAEQQVHRLPLAGLYERIGGEKEWRGGRRNEEREEGRMEEYDGGTRLKRQLL